MCLQYIHSNTKSVNRLKNKKTLKHIHDMKSFTMWRKFQFCLRKTNENNIFLLNVDE